MSESGEKQEQQVAEINTQQEEQIQKDGEKCLELKNKGNELFAKQNFKDAINIYNQAIDYCPIEDNKMLCILNSNISICQMTQFDYKLAIKHCTKALEFEPNFIKALINRAECYEKTNKFEKALEDYTKLKQLQPDNKEFLKKFIDLDLKVQEIQENQQKEAIKGLKGLKNSGNSVLSKLGLNSNDFNFQQNEDGTFNIQSKQ